MITVKIAATDANANAIVAAVAGRRIKVLDYVLVADAAVKVKWQSASTDISGLMNLAAAGYGVSSPGATNSLQSVPKLMTAAGEALNLHLSGAVVVGGHLTYEVID